nr:unnamed protein product [Digitaria exilis]
MVGCFLIGPTSFAPIIETAVGIVDSTGGQYHQRSESFKQQQPAATRKPDTYAAESALEDRLTCYECGKNLVRCPICQQNVTTRIRLY